MDKEYVEWNTTQPQNIMNNAIQSNMNGPRNDHTK